MRNMDLVSAFLGCPIIPTAFTEVTFSSTYLFGIFVENQMAVAM
jgi:hypothetical protein